MICEKTGFHALVEPYGVYIRGDSFLWEVPFTRGNSPYSEIDMAYDGISWPDLRIFRVCDVSRGPLDGVLHYTIYKVNQWFDQGQCKQGFIETLISERAEFHGYEGKPL